MSDDEIAASVLRLVQAIRDEQFRQAERRLDSAELFAPEYDRVIATANRKRRARKVS